MNAITERALAAARAHLRKLADANHDGRVDRQDVELVLQGVENLTRAQTVRRPLAAIFVAAVVGFALGFVVRPVFDWARSSHQAPAQQRNAMLELRHVADEAPAPAPQDPAPAPTPQDPAVPMQLPLDCGDIFCITSKAAFAKDLLQRGAWLERRTRQLEQQLMACGRKG